MNSLEWQAIQETNLLPSLNEFQRYSIAFQRDSASVHVSRSTKQWLEPNRNILGHICRQFSPTYTLKNEIILARSQSMIIQLKFKLVYIMPNRLFELALGNVIKFG